MAKIAVSIVNLNCLEHTRNLVADLDRQTFADYEVYFYDQNSTERGTKTFLNNLKKRSNYTVIQNGENKPLNHIWNEFANAPHGAEYICFLNNDIRITSNYLQDSYNVLSKNPRAGIAIHATNNRDYSTATAPTRHILENSEIKQGWEFMLRKSEWVDIPEILKFYCGDDFVFHNQYNAGRKAGVITSSPVIHKLSKTREAMGEDFIKKIKEQALADIDNYKKLGFPHKWNNLTKHSRMEQELKQITEVSTEQNLCKVNEYKSRLLPHLKDISNIDGPIVDIGVSDSLTFDLLLDAAMEQGKKLIGVDAIEHLNNDIVSNTSRNRPAQRILHNNLAQSKAEHFDLRCNGFMEDVAELQNPASFIFVGIFNPVKLRAILPILWETLALGGSIFFPYYHYDTCPDCEDVINEFFKDKQDDILHSRMQTIKGVRDTYLVIKKFTEGVSYEKRDKPLVVASVLKTGGIYDESYVNKLASAIKRHLNVEYKFVCFTDSKEDTIDLDLVDEIIPLEYELPGWWSKLELFRPEVFDDVQVLYFDLDTLIVNDIEDFASYGGEFLALRDFNTLLNMGSGVLSWNAKNCHHVFYKFIKELISGDITMQQFIGGDQQAIEHFLEVDVQWVQDVFPNKMAAFKYDCYDEASHEVHIPELSSVICFHSKPKMADLENDPEIIKHWR